jgi:Tol biopolymer transport system component
VFFASNHSAHLRALPNNSSSSPTAAYVKQHSLLLINESPHPEQGGSGPVTPAHIYTVHADGTGKTLRTNDGLTPSWTPDGNIMFASSRSGSQQIWIMNADGSGAKQIGNLPAGTLPVMPQEGTNGLIVFMGNDPTTEPDSNTGIWMMRSDGSDLKELVRGMQPSLALSGTWIAYTLQTDTPYHREIWRINTDGTGLKQLTFLGDDPDYPDANAPNISPNEQTVAFFSGKESDRAVPGALQQSVFAFGHRNVAIVPATGGVRRTLTPCRPVTTQAGLDAATEASGNCIAADNPAWTPDSKWLIFDTGFSTGNGTWMVDMNGQNYQQFYSQGRGIVRVPLRYIK